MNKNKYNILYEDLSRHILKNHNYRTLNFQCLSSIM